MLQQVTALPRKLLVAIFWKESGKGEVQGAEGKGMGGEKKKKKRKKKIGYC